jgi:ubiquinone/menaquinone biosynthesis C-methylase UbiE
MAMDELNPIQRAAQQQFDRQSERYGKGHILSDVSDVRGALGRLGTLKTGRALDVATGAGHTGLYLASVGWEVTLADISTAMLERAAATARERGLHVETRQHAAETLPYPDGSFDLVICRVAAHHFSDPAAFVRETARVLKPGGAFLLIDGSIEDGQPVAEEWLHAVEKFRDPSHHRLLSQGTWTKLCQEAGLRVVFSELQPFKQPDLNWYFDAANTSPENRAKVLKLIRTAPSEARNLFRLGEEDGKIVWWWQRLVLGAVKA